MQRGIQATSAESRKLDDSLTKLMGSLDKTTKAQQSLAAGTALLDRNLAAGNISANTHAAMLGKIGAAYGQTTEGAKGTSFATAGVSRELIVLGHEAVSGNFSRMPGTLMVLASRTGNLGAIFAALASPVGLATLAIGGLAAAMAYLGVKAAQAEKHMQALQDNMAATGRAGLYTRQMLDTMTDSLHKSGEISKEASKAIVDTFVRTRQIGGPLMQELVGIVERFARATGKDAPDAAKELAKAFADPEKGAKALDEELGLLTAAQKRLIEEQIRQGHTSQAQGMLLDALKVRMQGVGDATKYAADQMVREKALEHGVQLEEKTPGSGVQSGSSLRGAEHDKEQQALKETLNETKKLEDVDEKRKVLKDEILRLQEAQKIATGEEANIVTGRLLEAQRQLADLKGKGDQSRLQGYKAELEAMKTAEDGFLDFSKSREIEFWQGKLSLLRKGSADYAAVNQEIFTLRKGKAKQDLDEQVAEIKAQAALFRQGSQERVRAAQEAAKLIGAAYGLESKQYKDAQKEINAEQRAAQQYQRQVDEEILNAKRANAKIGFDIARDELAFKKAIGEIDAQEQIAGLRALEQKEYQMERQALEQKLQIAGVEPLERQKILGQIEALERTHQRKMVKLNQDAALEAQHRWTTFWQPVQGAFSSGIAGLIMKTQTLKQAFQSIAQAMLASTINLITEEVARWAAGTAAIKALKAALGISSVAIDTTSSVASIAAVKAEALAEIPSYSAIGAVAAGASVAAIPFIGWAMAPGVMAEQYALGMSFLPSAAGGWEVPADTMAMVHEQEMILPASISNHIRASMKGGGGDAKSGGDTHVHLNVSAVDGASVKKFFRENRGTLSKQITTSVRDHGLRMGASK